MQDFHPDCTINLLVQSHGRPGRYAWACSLLTRDSVRLLIARRYLGIVSREEAEWSALLFGLKQSQRLLQEKVQLCADFSPDLEGDGRLRDPRLQSRKAEASVIWKSFRLRKAGKLVSSEGMVLSEELAKAFLRKPKDG